MQLKGVEVAMNFTVENVVVAGESLERRFQQSLVNVVRRHDLAFFDTNIFEKNGNNIIQYLRDANNVQEVPFELLLSQQHHFDFCNSLFKDNPAAVVIPDVVHELMQAQKYIGNHLHYFNRKYLNMMRHRTSERAVRSLDGLQGCADALFELVHTIKKAQYYPKNVSFVQDLTALLKKADQEYHLVKHQCAPKFSEKRPVLEEKRPFVLKDTDFVLVATAYAAALCEDKFVSILSNDADIFNLSRFLKVLLISVGEESHPLLLPRLSDGRISVYAYRSLKDDADATIDARYVCLFVTKYPVQRMSFTKETTKRNKQLADLTAALLDGFNASG